MAGLHVNESLELAAKAEGWEIFFKSNGINVAFEVRSKE